MEQNLTFIKSNGQKIVGKAYIPDQGNGPFPAVIFSHGFNGTFSDIEGHGHGFSEAGIICIFFDFCGGGENSKSDGTLQEMNVLTEAEDLKVVIEEISRLEYVDSTHLFLQGESMGGFVSAYVAAQMPEKIKGLVLWYPAFVIPDDSRKRVEDGDNTCFGLQLSPDFNTIAMSIDIYEVIGNYHGPVRIIHGDKDFVVPLSYSEKAQRTYANAELDVIMDAEHGFNGADSETARCFSVSFIQENSSYK